jgi:serine-type D-Ala-D-Ala carboxypeptidase (penicillin-binding protein 5/6)
VSEGDAASVLARSNASPSTPPPGEEPTSRRSRRKRRRRERRSRRVLVVVAVLVVLLAGAGIAVAVRLSAPAPAPAVTVDLARSVHVPDATVRLPWPAAGQGAVAVPSIGVTVGSPAQKPVPVASLTKLMTAYVVLHDHPLTGSAAGPDVTVTSADVADYDYDTNNNDTNAKVSVGEVVNERELLGGLLVHSADNYADLLARWDAGSVTAFVAKMNAVAAQLGMTQTHFADPSGISAASRSTASDILKVAVPDMKDPVVDSLVLMRSVWLPEAGTITSYTPLVGLDGIIGVKSGVTTQAGGCDVLAVMRTVHGVPTLVLAAITGQTGPGVLVTAGLHALDLADTAAKDIGAASVLTRGQVAATVSVGSSSVDARSTSSVTVLTWPGAAVKRQFEAAAPLGDQARRGARVGTVVVTLGAQRTAVPVRLSQDVPRLSWEQRLF